MIISIKKCGMKLLIYSQPVQPLKFKNDNLIPHFTGHVNTYTCWDQSWTILVKMVTDVWFEELSV